MTLEMTHHFKLTPAESLASLLVMSVTPEREYEEGEVLSGALAKKAQQGIVCLVSPWEDDPDDPDIPRLRDKFIRKVVGKNGIIKGGNVKEFSLEEECKITLVWYNDTNLEEQLEIDQYNMPLNIASDYGDGGRISQNSSKDSPEGLGTPAESDPLSVKVRFIASTKNKNESLKNLFIFKCTLTYHKNKIQRRKKLKLR